MEIDWVGIAVEFAKIFGAGFLINLATPSVAQWWSGRRQVSALAGRRRELEKYRLLRELWTGKKDKYLYVTSWQFLTGMYFAVGLMLSAAAGGFAWIMTVVGTEEWLRVGLVAVLGFAGTVFVFFSSVAWGRVDDVTRKLLDFPAYEEAVTARYAPTDDEK